MLPTTAEPQWWAVLRGSLILFYVVGTCVTLPGGPGAWGLGMGIERTLSLLVFAAIFFSI